MAAAAAAAVSEDVESATDYLLYKSSMPEHKDVFFVKKPDERCREIVNDFYVEGGDESKTILEPIKAGEESGEDIFECERYDKFNACDIRRLTIATPASSTYYKKDDFFLQSLTQFIPRHISDKSIQYMDISILRRHEEDTYKSLSQLYPMQWNPMHPQHGSILRLSNQIKSHNFKLSYKKFDTGEICVVPKQDHKKIIESTYNLYTIKTSQETILFRSVYEQNTYSIVDRVNGTIKEDRLATLISTTYSLDFALKWLNCDTIYMIRISPDCPIFIVNDDLKKNNTQLPRAPIPFVMKPSEYQYEVTLLPGTFTINHVSKTNVNGKEFYIFDTTYKPVDISKWDKFFDELICKEGRQIKRTRTYKKRKNKKKRTHKQKGTHKKQKPAHKQNEKKHTKCSRYKR
jgi:hypothetical protein